MCAFRIVFFKFFFYFSHLYSYFFKVNEELDLILRFYKILSLSSSSVAPVSNFVVLVNGTQASFSSIYFLCNENIDHQQPTV